MAGLWSIIVPEATKNYLPNPSLETGTTGFTDYSTGSASGARVRQMTWSKRDRYSYYALKSGGGATDLWGFYQLVPEYAEFVAGDYATFSVDLHVISGTVKLWLQVVAGTTLDAQNAQITADGRYSVTVGPIVGTVTSVRALLAVNSATGFFYADGWQVERKDHATTYCDGSRQDGVWLGSPHASSSTRPASSRAGGREINLDSYTCYVLESPGIGMPAVKHLTQPQALLPGSVYKGYKVQPRLFTLALMAPGSSKANMHSLRKALLDVLKPDAVPGSQPVTLRYSGANASQAAEIQCYYDSGLEYGRPDGFTDEITLRLIAYDPFWYADGDAAKDLSFYSQVAMAYIASRIEGVWAQPSSGVAGGYVRVMRRGPDNKIYMGGSFTSAGGVANTRGIAVFDPLANTFAALGSGAPASAEVYDLRFDPAGLLYACGDFTSMGGVANTANLATWNGSVWASITATNANGLVYGLALDPATGNLYITGNFTTVNAVAANRLATLPVGGAWAAVGGTGLSDYGLALAFGPDGALYVGGQFTTANGVTVNRIARWDGAAFQSMGGGTTTGNINKLLVRANGQVVAAGAFTSMGGLANTGYIAAWNGTAWSALGTGLAGGSAWEAQEDEEGRLWVGGAFTSAGGLALADRLAIWNGSTWVQADIDLPGSATIFGLLVIDARHLYLGFNTTGNGLGAAQTAVVNAGTATAYPQILILGSGSGNPEVVYLKNETTGDTLFLNYTLLNGELLTLDFTPGARECRSSFRGRVMQAVLQASDFGTFGLAPGSNTLSLYVNGGIAYAAIQYRNTLWSVDGVAA